MMAPTQQVPVQQVTPHQFPMTPEMLVASSEGNPDVPVLSLVDVSVSTRNGDALVKDVSFDLYGGRCVGIVGESGSGKSMICKAICGLLPKRAFHVGGKVLFRGFDMCCADEVGLNRIRGRELALIMQNPMTALDPSFTIGNQAIETLRTHKKASRKQAYGEVVARLTDTGLPRVHELMRSYPSMLSGGMLQRVMIAMAMMHDPSVIVADEATTALDVRTQARILDDFAQAKEHGVGLLLVSHDFGVVAALADYLYVMRKGSIVEQGSLRECLNNPKTDYTRELLEASLLEPLARKGR